MNWLKSHGGGKENCRGYREGRFRYLVVTGRSRAEEGFRRLADYVDEVTDHMGLVGEAAAVSDIRPRNFALPRDQNRLNAREARKLLRACTKHRLEATEQMPWADIEF